MSNIFGESSFASRMSYRSDAEELSESRYNLTLGASLTWGFFVNYLILQFGQTAILNWVYGTSYGFLTFLILYFVLAGIGSRLVRSYDAAQCFLGYNLIAVPIGMLLSIALIGYDPTLVTRAALSTAIVTLSMMIVSMLIPDTFTRMGPVLGIALLGTIIAESLSMLIFRAAVGIYDWIIVAIMCLYIGYDWVRANSVQRTTTNAIAAASALYLDIINIFLRLLSILSRSERNRK